VFKKGGRRTGGQADGYVYIDSAVDADQGYMYFMGSATPPSACYALCTSTGSKK